MNVHNPNFKIGIKDLMDEQLRTALPTYGLIEQKLNKIRKTASQVGIVNSSEFFENLKYDNIFSILGGRGAGKTSILLTLYKKYQECNDNIMLPFIMPELIDSNESIISWLLSSMDSNLVQFENKIREFGIVNKSKEYIDFCYENRIFDRCSFNCNNNLRKKLEQIKDSYYATEYKNYGFTSDYSSFKELLAKGVDSNFNLINLFCDYWSTLVKTYKKFIKEKDNLDVTPLIYIFIDDADLKPQIINELLFVIPKYLSHPNVVVFVSASHKTLTYVVKNYMFESITRKSLDLTSLMKVECEYNSESIRQGNGRTVKFNDLRYGKEYDKVRKLSEEVLRKIFPMYNRFCIKKYDRYEDKGLLKVYKTDEYNCTEVVKISDKIFCSANNFYKDIIKIHKSSTLFNDSKNNETLKKKKDNFKLISYDSSENQEKVTFGSDFYLAFLGKYSRDITSVYYTFEDMLYQMKELLSSYYHDNTPQAIGSMPPDFNEAMYEITTKFIAAAVSSNHNLNIFSRFVTDMVKTQLLHWQLYVNYSKVIDIFKSQRFVENNKNNFEPFIEMMCLLNFVEQFIVLVVPQRRTCHGHEEIQELFRLCGIKVIKYENNVDSLFKQYYLFHSLNIIPNFDIYRREHRGSFIKGVVDNNLIKNNFIRDNGSIIEWKADEIRYKEWYDVLYSVLFRNFSLISKSGEYLNDLLILKDFKFLDNEYYLLRSKYMQKLEESLIYENNDFLSEVFPFDELEKIIDDTSESISSLKISEKLDNLETSITELILRCERNKYEELKSSVEPIKKFNFDLWKLIIKLIDEIREKRNIKRSNLIAKLSSVDLIIDDMKYYYFPEKREIHYYWNIFKENLHNFVVISKDCKSYKEYTQACKEIDGVYEKYVSLYAKMIHCKVLMQNKPVNSKPDFSWEQYKKIRDMQSIHFTKLGIEEWRKLIGERNYE